MNTLVCPAPVRTAKPYGSAAPAPALPAVARYRFDFEVRRHIVLPAFAGSMLRGVFGHALRHSACATGQPQCTGCPLRARCLYARVFDSGPPAGATAQPALQNFSQIPRPYVIEPPLGGARNWNVGETLSFHLVLVGSALGELPRLAHSLAQALAHDVGPAHGAAVLQQVSHILPHTEQTVLAGPGGPLAAHDTRPPAPAHTAATAVTLHFDTPLRLQNNGRRATAAEHTPARLLNALVRRTALLAQYHGDGPLALDFGALAAQAAALDSQPRLRWQDGQRYSSRQRRTLVHGGVTGRWHLRGELTPFLPFLHLGQWLHVGKETVFGFGGYRLEVEA